MEQRAFLTHDNVAKIETSGRHQDAHQCETHRDFVRNDLRSRAHGAQGAYFELEAQPAMMTPYTPSDVMAST